LVPRPTITLHLDYKQNGVGSGSCGPGVMLPYQLHAEPFTFRVAFRPLVPDQGKLLAIGRAPFTPPPGV
jgi:hypothetical protein